MKQIEKNNIAVVTIVVLMISLVICASNVTLINSSAAGGGQNGDWIIDPDGSGDFLDIDDALENESVQDGHTLLLNDGDYFGPYTVNKEVTITVNADDEEYDATIKHNGLFLGEPTITLNADDSSIKNVAIRSDANYIIRISGEDVTISNVDIQGGASRMIDITSSAQSPLIEKCMLDGSSYEFSINSTYGIFSDNSNIAHIQANYFRNINYNSNSYAIYIDQTDYGNIIYNEITDCENGIKIISTYDLDIYYNNIFLNTGYGIYCYGTSSIPTGAHQIDNNDFTSNGNYAVFLGDYCNGSSLELNNFIQNKESGNYSQGYDEYFNDNDWDVYTNGNHWDEDDFDDNYGYPYKYYVDGENNYDDYPEESPYGRDTGPSSCPW